MAGNELRPLRLVNLCRHKTAGWEGFIFLNAHGEIQITNGICVWPLTSRRMNALEIMEAIDTQRVLARFASHPGNGPVAALLQEELPDFRQDVQYLSNPALDGVCYIIEDDHVRIDSPHTCLVEARREYQISRNKLLREYRQVSRLAEELNVTIYDTGINNTEQTLKARWNEYETAIAGRENLFSSMVIQARVVKARGIRRGYAKDKELSALLELQKQVKSYDSEDCVIPCINSLSRKLANMRDRLFLELDNLTKTAVSTADMPAAD